MNCIFPRFHKFKLLSFVEANSDTAVKVIWKCSKCGYMTNYKDDKVSEEDYKLLQSSSLVSVMIEIREAKKEFLLKLGISRDEYKALMNHTRITDSELLLLMISRIDRILEGK